jgi:hypothetical protein
MTIEQRMERLERQNKRFKVALALLTVALCAGVTMGADGYAPRKFDGITEFDIIHVGNIGVLNGDGQVVVEIGAKGDVGKEAMDAFRFDLARDISWSK